MRLDARTLPDGYELETELCIVGSGPAGLTVARELAADGARLCILESGGRELDGEVQQLGRGTVVGDDYGSLASMQRRQLGGNSHVWCMHSGGEILVRYVPLDAIDFEERAWVPGSGWPITRAELDPFYARAQRLCRIGPHEYDPEEWESAGRTRLELDAERLSTSVFQFGSGAVFNREFVHELERQRNVTVIHDGTALELETDGAGKRVLRLRGASLRGTRFAIRARRFVLAAGGIQNPRLLLCSDRLHRNGLGNAHDLVGRCFMDHPLIDSGELVPASRRLIAAARLYDAHSVNGVTVMAKLGFSERVLCERELLNISILLLPVSRSVESFKVLLGAASRRTRPNRLSAHLMNAAGGPDQILAAVYRKLRRHADAGPDIDHGGWSIDDARWSKGRFTNRRFDAFKVLHQTEQAPDPSNRVTLTDERDALGQRVPRLHWRWGDANSASVARAQELLAQELERSGLGRFRIERAEGKPRLLKASTHHHIGTTRMHADPKRGVVDVNCRVHGAVNLYVAGSSVFPTGGYANPTLSIVALAIRLADHLKVPGS